MPAVRCPCYSIGKSGRELKGQPALLPDAEPERFAFSTGLIQTAFFSLGLFFIKNVTSQRECPSPLRQIARLVHRRIGVF